VTIDFLLLVVILIYFVLAMLWGALHWKHMKEPTDEKEGREYHLNHERIVLMLAGFSLTALSILIGLQSREQTQISSILVFFSVAFSSLLLSAVIVRFRIAEFFIYLSDRQVKSILKHFVVSFVVLNTHIVLLSETILLKKR